VLRKNSPHSSLTNDLFNTLNKTQLGKNKTTQNKGVVSTEVTKIEIESSLYSKNRRSFPLKSSDGHFKDTNWSADPLGDLTEVKNRQIDPMSLL